MDIFIVLLVVASGIWVYFDAKSIGAERGLSSGFLNMGPVGWAMSTVLLWIICFPLYLIKRDDIRALAAGEKSPISAINKPTAVNTASKIIGLGWSILCFAGVVIGLIALGDVANQYGDSQAGSVGVTIGAGLGMGFWFFLWVTVAGPAALVFFLTRKSTVITIAQDEHKADPNSTKQCPYCAETILKEANFCRYCKQSLTTNPQNATETDGSTNIQITEDSAAKKTPDLLSRGKHLLRKENNQEAIATLTRYLEISPTDGDALYFRAIAFSRMKDIKKMETDLKNAAKFGNKKAQEVLAKTKAKSQCTTKLNKTI